VNGNSHVVNFHSPLHGQHTSHSIPYAKNSSTTDNAANKNSHFAHHHANTTTTTSGNKMRNNVGHKASQMRRIQLSTAAKRCKSIENHHYHKTATAAMTTTDEDEIEEENPQVNAVNEDISSANNSHTTNQSATESPTLVRVKTWYTESHVQLPATFTLHEQP
jgi:hypothetical protein